MSGASAGVTALSQAVRAMRPVVVALMILYFFAVLDRLNVGFAALTMNNALGLSPSQFGFGAGLFFYPYVLMEVPSNLLMTRYGPRRWIARIVITWGIVSTATAFVTGPHSFYAVRILLGAAEAGFFPAVITYIARWFPARERARMNTLFLLGIPLSGVVSSFLATVCLSLDGLLGLAGWQWLFVCEGVPPILLGIAVLFFLPDDPSTARFMTQAQSEALTNALNAEQAAIHPGTPLSTWQVLRSPTCLLLAVAYFGITVGLSTLGFWLPQAVGSLGGHSPVVIALLTAVPLGFGALTMIAVAISSDRSGDRLWHFACMTLMAALGWLLFGLFNSPSSGLAFIAIAAGGTYGMFSLFWTIPSVYLSGRAAAAGIAFISAVGTTGAAVGPWAIGQLRQFTGNFGLAFSFVAACIAVGGLIGLMVGRRIFQNADLSSTKPILAID
jgi:ACS family tartrate transporter-like MFS transporter